MHKMKYSDFLKNSSSMGYSAYFIKFWLKCKYHQYIKNVFFHKNDNKIINCEANNIISFNIGLSNA